MTTTTRAAFEPSFDPTDAINTAIDAGTTAPALYRAARPTDDDEPAGVDAVQALNKLCNAGTIDEDSRDAGEILRFMVRRAAPNGQNANTHVGYPWRDAAGAWSAVTSSRQDVQRRLDAAMAAIRSDRARQAVTLLLVARVPTVGNVAHLTTGLGDLVKHFWPTKTHVRNGITLAGDDCTPERLKHANDNTVTTEGARWLVDGFERMFQRGQLDDNPETNTVLHAAGLRYQSDHHAAGMSPLGALDYSREFVDGGSQQVMSERMEGHRWRFRQAVKAVGPRYAAILDAILVDGRTLSDAGAANSKYRDKASAKAVAGERLNAALRALSAHYDGLDTGRPANDNTPFRGFNRGSARVRSAVPAEVA